MTDLERRSILKAWLPVVLWMLVIFIASTDLGSASHTSRVIEPLLKWINPTASPEQFDLVHFLVRKAAHLTEYAILALLILRAVRMSGMPDFRKAYVRAASVALLASAAYAATDEFHQSFVSMRTASVHDVFIDALGAFAGLTILGLTERIRSSSEISERT